MKAITKLFAIAVAACGALAFAGCRGSSSEKMTATTANWNVRVSNSVEKNSLDFWKTHKEVATYDVSQEDGSNSAFLVKYETGVSSYTTALYAEEYDWSTAVEAYKKDEKEDVYVFETELKISGQYVMKDETEAFKAFEDSLVTVSKFRLCGKNLQPVYSKQVIKNTSPNKLSPSTIEDAYGTVDAVYETYYNFDLSEATVYFTDNLSEAEDKTTERKIEIDRDDEYSVFDNSQLRLAMRAMSLSSSTQKQFNVVVPQNGAVQQCVLTTEKTQPLNEENADEAAIFTALQNAGDYIFFKDTPKEDETPKTIRYNNVKVVLNEDMPGTSVNVWYTTVENPSLNYSRGVMLKVSTPLTFYLGTVNYNLAKLELVG